MRIGHGYDVHALADGLPLVLGGIEIPHMKGFVAHSDGDVAIHAVCDALLGAAALGDIGIHFPDTSIRKFCSAGLLRCCANGDTKSGMSIVRSGCNGPNCGRISTPCAPRWPVQWA